MTRNQLSKKLNIARTYGDVEIEDGAVIVWRGRYFSLIDKYGNTVDTGYSSNDFWYLCTN